MAEGTKTEFTTINTLKTMSKIDIKVGETYNVRMRVNLISHGLISAETVLGYDEKDGIQCGEVYDICVDEADAFSPLPEQTKHDPCRKFKEGDKAKPRIINGREIPKMPLDVIFTVTGDEDEYGAVPVEYMSPVRGLLTSTTVHAVWLELVTPVEEQEPYYIERRGEKEGGWCYIVYKHGGYAESTFYFGACRSRNEAEAKEAAEAERDRLNAEYRKEQK